MTVPVLTFFNNKGGVGKTSLVYHLAWMLAERGYRVLACDLDPQANLTSMFLEEDRLESVYEGSDGAPSPSGTIFECVRPLMEVGDLRSPTLQEISTELRLIPGDLALAGFEDTLSAEWPNALRSTDLYRPFRILTAFSTIMQDGARQMDASIILADVEPNLGAINRSALISTEYVVVPVGADLFSLRGLRNLGPTLETWRREWQKRLENWSEPGFELPRGRMAPIGYVVQQHGVRLSRGYPQSSCRCGRMTSGSTECLGSTPGACSEMMRGRTLAGRKMTCTPSQRSSTTGAWSRWPKKRASPCSN